MAREGEPGAAAGARGAAPEPHSRAAEPGTLRRDGIAPAAAPYKAGRVPALLRGGEQARGNQPGRRWLWKPSSSRPGAVRPGTAQGGKTRGGVAWPTRDSRLLSVHQAPATAGIGERQSDERGVPVHQRCRDPVCVHHSSRGPSQGH